ncbi:MAG: hypothetical protein ABR84_04870 [Cryomorphaceae bacterium BACL21 MAG-121220-bin10]|jgi:hypothetical protein|nr:MAG: hypothetical protein ABR84_04870 [Cryomorphaceae bacterium BACL21 MAG-121220-bin10]
MQLYNWLIILVVTTIILGGHCPKKGEMHTVRPVAFYNGYITSSQIKVKHLISPQDYHLALNHPSL